MKLILSAIFTMLSHIFSEFRKVMWKLRSGYIHMKVWKGYSYEFFHFGDITRMLYARQHLIRYNRSFEYETVRKFLEVVKPSDTVFDIGANIGVYSLLSSDLVGEAGRVYSFEPSDETYSTLKKNVTKNKKTNISLNKIALSDQKGEVKLGVSTLSSNHKYNDAFNHMQFENDGEKQSGESVPMDTLDNFCLEKNINKIDLIKIDIEGAELLCLRGAYNSIKRFRPTIIFEMEDSFCKRFNYNSMDLLIYIHEFGYELSRFDGYNWLATPHKGSNYDSEYNR